MAKYQHPANPDRVRADRELRRSNAAVPQETRDKRLRTDERVIADELKKEQDDNWTELILEFEKQTGRLPNMLDLMMLAEARASVELDKDPRAQTFSLGSAEEEE